MQVAPPLILEERGRGTTFVLLGIVAALAGVALLYLYNPVEAGFYPRCFFKIATGLDCPGCGGLRATHQLLHGHLRAAFQLNPLYVAALPVGMLFLIRAGAERWSGRKWPRLFRSTTLVWMGAGAVLVFGVLRNLPWRGWFEA